MAQSILEKLKNIDIPINVSRKPNNYDPASKGLVLYNDSVNLYEAIKLVATDLITTTVVNPTTEDVQDIIGAMLTNSSSVSFTYNDAGGTITAAVIPGGVNHDALLNFVANEHIDHSAVSILAGTGLTGGGDLTASRTLALTNTGVTAGTYGDASTVGFFTVDAQGRLTSAGEMPIIIGTSQITDLEEYIEDTIGGAITAGSGISVNYNDVTNTITISSSVSSYTNEMAQDAVGSILTDSSTIDFTYNDASNTISASVIVGAIDHDALLNFVANEHINHSSVSIIAGTGLSGGGDLTASRTLSITDTGVVANSYGSASEIPIFTVNAQGQLTTATTASVLISASQVSNFSEAVDDRVAALLTAGTNITLSYNDASNTLTINSTGGGGGSITGSGANAQLTYWTSATNIDGDANLVWDGTGIGINQVTVPLGSIINSTGTGTSSLTSGYTHSDSTSTPVFRVADDGSIYLGSGVDPLSIGSWGMTKGDTFYFSTSTDKIRFVPGTYVHIDGDMKIDLGSDATGDLYYRGPSGTLVRLPIGTGSQVLIGGTTPSWGTVSGTLPGGSAGDIAMHDGSGWLAVTRMLEKQTGVSGTAITVASLPLSYAAFDLYKNGVLQDDPEDYTRSGTSVTMTLSLLTTDKITMIYYI